MMIKYLFNQLKLYYSVFYSGTLLLWQILESTCRKEVLFWLTDFESLVRGQLAPLLWVTYDIAKLLTLWHTLPLSELLATLVLTHIFANQLLFSIVFLLCFFVL